MSSLSSANVTWVALYSGCRAAMPARAISRTSSDISTATATRAAGLRRRSHRSCTSWAAGVVSRGSTTRSLLQEGKKTSFSSAVHGVALPRRSLSSPGTGPASVMTPTPWPTPASRPRFWTATAPVPGVRVATMHRRMASTSPTSSCTCPTTPHPPTPPATRAASTSPPRAAARRSRFAHLAQTTPTRQLMEYDESIGAAHESPWCGCSRRDRSGVTGGSLDSPVDA